MKEESENVKLVVTVVTMEYQPFFPPIFLKATQKEAEAAAAGAAQSSGLISLR